ncbi:MAG: ATP-dependent DNA helicase RecQ [Spirochaetales bacterium]|nr:ATP-dependent DNA helicase RecQ [Spirochaetales bacterium]
MDHITSLARERFGINAVRPFQYLVIRRILEEDKKETPHPGMIVTLPTGSGKSLCFMLPTLVVSGLTIIVYPLLALMSDQMRRFEEARIPVLCLKGGQSRKERARILSRLADVRALVTNAETLANPGVLSTLLHVPISMIVIDEAHTIERWGSSFRPALRTLSSLIAHLRPRQTLCFTATADDAVINQLNTLFFNGEPAHLVRGSSDRENIAYHSYPALSKSRAITTLLHNPSTRPAIVFAPTRALTERLARYFRISNPALDVRYYHAGLPKDARLAIEEWYYHHPDGVLFSTNAYGMGMDKKNIRTVIHYAPPSDALAFLQESGRAGRDGLPAQSIVLINEADRSSPLFPIFNQHERCYRSLLLSLMDEELEHCFGCGVCLNHRILLREGERPILRTIFFNPLKYTPYTLALMLQKKDARVLYSGSLSTWRIREIEEAVRTLVAERKILQPPFLKGKMILLPQIDKRGRDLYSFLQTREDRHGDGT